MWYFELTTCHQVVVGQKHTGVILIALVAKLKMGCAHTFSPLKHIGEAQRLLEAWKTILFCFLQL